jgi:U3-containing 90S pre-ribosomal complex subunit
MLNMAEALSQTPQKSRRHGSKRKRGLTDDGNLPKKTALETPKRCPAANGDIDQLIGHMNPGLIADHFAKKIKRSFRDLSVVELEDKYLSQRIFFDTSDFELPRELDNLPSFLERFSASIEDLSTSSEDPSSPHTLVIAASGLRAADVTRFDASTSSLFLHTEYSGQIFTKISLTRICCCEAFCQAYQVPRGCGICEAHEVWPFSRYIESI